MAGQNFLKYSENSAKFSNQRPDHTIKLGIKESLKVAIEIFCRTKIRSPKAKLPEVRPDLNDFLVQEEKVKFIWFGHSTIMLNLEGQIILIDPVFSKTATPSDWIGKRFQPPVFKLEELPKIDVIVISHDHYDHLDEKTIRFFHDKSTAFIVPLKVGGHLREWGIANSRITELNWYESVHHNNLTYVAVPAHHSSGRGLFDQNSTLWASWIIQGKSEKIYYSGDSGFSDHFQEIGHRYGPFDLAFMENGQYDERWPDAHMMPQQTIQAVKDIKARAFVPVHWGMFDLSLHYWSDPVVQIYKLSKKLDLSILTPRLGELVKMGSTQGFSPWWEEVLRADYKDIVPQRAQLILP